MKSLAVLALAGALACSAVAGPGAAAPPFSCRVTVQVHAEPNYTARDVGALLESSHYLGAVRSGLVPFDSSGGEAPPAGTVGVSAALPAPEILALELIGADRDAVEQATKALLANLAAIVPSSRADANARAAATEQSLERARTRMAEAQARMRAYVESRGVTDPTQDLNQARANLQQATIDLGNVRVDISSHRALAEYLRRAFEAQPKDVVDQAALQFREAVEAQVAEVADRVEKLEKTLAAGHPEAMAAKDELAVLRAKATSLRLESAAHPNPRRASLEEELFRVERELALAEERTRFLDQRVAELRAEMRALSLAESEYRLVRDERNLAENQVAQLQAEHAGNLNLVARAGAGPWLQVIAGPVLTPAGR